MRFAKFILVPAAVALAMMSGCGRNQEIEASSSMPTAAEPASLAGTASSSMTNGPQYRGQQASAQQSSPPPSPSPGEEGLIRVRFNEVFTVNSDGSYSPKLPVDINGAQMTPGVTFGGGVQFGGFTFGQLAGRDLGVRQLPNGFVELVKYYN